MKMNKKVDWFKFWDNINWNLLNKIRRKKKKPSIWDLK